MSLERTNLADRRVPSWRRWLTIVVGLLVVAAIIWIGALGIRLYQRGRAAWRLVQTIEPLARQAAADPQQVAAWETLQLQVAQLEEEMKALRADLVPYWPLLRRLDRLPGVGAEAAAAPDLLEASIELLAAGRLGLDQGIPLLKATTESAAVSPLETIASMLPRLQAGADIWPEMTAHVDRASAHLQAVDASRLRPPLGPRLAQIQETLPRLRPLLDLFPLLPDLLGADGERHYLIVAQNSDELRPTGGFVSGVGLVRVAQGKITILQFEDSYAVDNHAQPHPPAPEALRRLMGAKLLFLRDANWSPDFPTSARILSTIYKLDRGIAVDGVVAVDLFAVRALVAALAPLSVPGREIPITGDNVIAQMRAAWDEPVEGVTIEQNIGEWVRRRKEFMPTLVQAMMARVAAGEVDLRRLGSALTRAAVEKHLLVYLDHPAAQVVISTIGWDGSIQPGAQDYLAIYDTNFGYNKVNALVTRQTDYRVAWEQAGWTAHLTLTYTHPAPATAGPCKHESVYGQTYDDLTRRCYWDYLRVYAPAGSQVLAAEGLEAVEVEEGEAGATVIAGEFVLPPGTSHSVRLVYRLPDAVVQEGVYRLRIQKQPGIAAMPLRVALRGQPGSLWVGEDGQRGEEIAFEALLSQDSTWSAATAP